MVFCRFFFASNSIQFCTSIMKKKAGKITIKASSVPNTANIVIDGYIFDFTQNSASSFKAQVNELLASGFQDVLVYINSLGGDCFEAAEIANVIRMFPGKITGQLGAKCGSAATYIACKCDFVIAAPNLNYMFHKPMGDISGNADELLSQVKAVQNLEAEYLDAYVKKTGLTADEIKTMWVQDYWMNATEAKEKGFIDEILSEDAEITEEDVLDIEACGYDNIPSIQATVIIKPKNNQSTNQMKKELLITAMGMDSASTDEQVLAEFTAVVSKAKKYDTANTELIQVKAQALDSKVEATLDKHAAAKKFTAAQRSFFKKNLLEDFDGTDKMLESIPAVQALSTIPEKEGNKEDRSTWTWDSYTEKDPKGLHAMASHDPTGYNRLAVAKFGATWKATDNK